ncbi:MAG: PD-(D/E)XK nuclease family protein [Rikenellaceae bacterium]|jgi:RecB family exonuclease|nr:PD-(D/E)XK nuclease family protein [Rikenellaceae bacterium]
MVEGFLKQVAGDLYGRYGDEVSSLSVLFPNRRARLFFGDALSGIVPRPVWQPASVTIDQLMEEISGLSVGDSIRIITELYKIYREYHPTESFDKFYFWGELLVGDFDSIDKYLINADVLFSNLVDLHDLDERFDYLEPEQVAIIARFWKSFGEESDFSTHQRDFITVWRTLSPIYHRFRARLEELGIAYAGMVYRRAAERILSGRAVQIPERRYVVAGFNALSECEKVLFDFLRTHYPTDFYWDWDNYYLSDERQEAGMFLRENLKRYPPAATFSTDNFVKPKRIASVATASGVLQCKYVNGWLEALRAEKRQTDPTWEPGKETAIVLTNENLLVPLLYSLPPDIAEINVTMGYPLRMHPAYTFVERLIELQNRRRESRNSLAFYHSDVEGLLGHPYLAGQSEGAAARAQYVYIGAAKLATSPLLERIFSAPQGWQGLSDWLLEIISAVARLPTDGSEGGQRVEFFDVIASHIRALAGSLAQCDIELSVKIYASLLRRSLQSVTGPFEGEPLAGVQVMGILETRALDFENIVFLSMNDSNSPGNLSGAPSFIPYNLKMAYGLPTPEHHEGVYAYHFFRLTQRAERVDMVWSSTSDERNTGEPSRYIYQLEYESPHTVEHRAVSVDVNLTPTESITVPKSPDIMEALNAFLRTDEPRKLSPSLFFAYVECPLKFYFRGVAGLRADEEVAEEVDSAMFGTILHTAMEILYTPLLGVRNPQSRIRSMIGTEAVESAVTEAARAVYAKEEDADPSQWGGNMILVHRTIVDYINRNILPFDAQRAEAYTIEKLEEWVSGGVDFAVGKERHSVCFYGKVDRLDRLADGTLRVVDYKTGTPKTAGQDNERFQSIDTLFTGRADQRISAVLQTLLYSMMLRVGGERQVQPTLYYVKNLSKENYPLLFIETGEGKRPVTQYGDYSEEFETRLRDALSELFDPSVPFTQTPDPFPCKWCDFATVCQR